jgi:hypothetical protein
MVGESGFDRLISIRSGRLWSALVWPAYWKKEALGYYGVKRSTGIGVPASAISTASTRLAPLNGFWK